MHIPDGYLSPQTAIPAIVATVPFWSIALGKVKSTFKKKQLPLLALCSAFSFVIMMFNVPLGESSVHAVGAVFVAILIGPWAACVAVSAALIIQAFVFGDGGILVIGANCFNMAVVMPFVGYYAYKLIAGSSPMTSRRSMAGIFIGGYLGLNAAALLTAVEFGIQPLLFTAADGTPLYGFYPLSVSVPVMMFEHLLFAGPIEGAVTMGAMGYIVRFAPHLLHQEQAISASATQGFFTRYKPFIVGLCALVVLSPIGLIATGTAWGEWGGEEIAALWGHIPQGLEQFSGTWSAWMPDYALPGLSEGFFASALGYIISAIVGIGLIGLITYISSKIALREKKEHHEV